MKHSLRFPSFFPQSGILHLPSKCSKASSPFAYGGTGARLIVSENLRLSYLAGGGCRDFHRGVGAPVCSLRKSPCWVCVFYPEELVQIPKSVDGIRGVLSIIAAEVMIGDEGFTQRNGTAQVETESLNEAEMKIVIDCD